MELKVLFDNILIKKEEETRKSEGGILMTPVTTEKTSIARVSKVGPGAINPYTHEFVPTVVKEGDRIIFAKNNVIDVDVDGEKLSFITEKDVLCIIHD